MLRWILLLISSEKEEYNEHLAAIDVTTICPSYQFFVASMEAFAATAQTILIRNQDGSLTCFSPFGERVKLYYTEGTPKTLFGWKREVAV